MLPTYYWASNLLSSSFISFWNRPDLGLHHTTGKCRTYYKELRIYRSRWEHYPQRVGSSVGPISFNPGLRSGFWKRTRRCAYLAYWCSRWPCPLHMGTTTKKQLQKKRFSIQLYFFCLFFQNSVLYPPIWKYIYIYIIERI